MPPTYPIWDEYYDRRLEWAKKANNDFIETIGNVTFRSLYNQNSTKSVNIAVYGQSQVGKTTLILKLIGIKEEYYEEVANVLRADISPGKSVTPTSVIYKRSTDKDFYYKEGNIECKVTADELKQKLKDLRTRVEKNIELDNLEELKSNVLIKIPMDYFEEKNILNINIIDLPGYGSANDKEQRHVKKVIESIIPILNIVLIVSNKITDLVKSDKPCRQFRYILTRSVSSNSVKKKFEEGVITDKDNYLKFVRSEFKELSEEVTVYPLEYGDSWEMLDKKIKEKAEVIIDELFEDLRKDISESSTEYNQLMQNVHHFKDIEKIIEQELEKFKIEIERKKRKKGTLKNEKSNLEILNNECIIENEKLIYSKYLNTYYNFTYDNSAYTEDITVTKLESFLTKFIEGISKEAKEKWKKLEGEYEEIQWQSALNKDFNEICNEICSNESAVMLNRLANYKVNWYSALTGNAVKDKKGCEAVCNEIFVQIKNKIETRFTKGVEKYNNDIDDKVKENENRIKNYSYKIHKNQTSIEKAEKEKEEIKTKKEEFEKNAISDLETAKTFKQNIEKYYSREKNETIKKMNDIETPSEMKFFNLLYLSLISSEFEKLKNQP